MEGKNGRINRSRPPSRFDPTRPPPPLTPAANPSPVRPSRRIGVTLPSVRRSVSRAPIPIAEIIPRGFDVPPPPPPSPQASFPGRSFLAFPGRYNFGPPPRIPSSMPNWMISESFTFSPSLPMPPPFWAPNRFHMPPSHMPPPSVSESWALPPPQTNSLVHAPQRIPILGPNTQYEPMSQQVDDMELEFRPSPRTSTIIRHKDFQFLVQAREQGEPLPSTIGSITFYLPPIEPYATIPINLVVPKRFHLPPPPESPALITYRRSPVVEFNPSSAPLISTSITTPLENLQRLRLPSPPRMRGSVPMSLGPPVTRDIPPTPRMETSVSISLETQRKVNLPCARCIKYAKRARRLNLTHSRPAPVPPTTEASVPTSSLAPVSTSSKIPLPVQREAPVASFPILEELISRRKTRPTPMRPRPPIRQASSSSNLLEQTTTEASVPTPPALQILPAPVPTSFELPPLVKREVSVASLLSGPELPSPSTSGTSRYENLLNIEDDEKCNANDKKRSNSPINVTVLIINRKYDMISDDDDDDQ